MKNASLGEDMKIATLVHEFRNSFIQKMRTDLDIDQSDWEQFSLLLARTGQLDGRPALYFSYPTYFTDLVPLVDTDVLTKLSWACRAALDHILLYDYLLDRGKPPDPVILLTSYAFQKEYLRNLADLYPPDSKFWLYQQDFETQTMRALLDEKKRQKNPLVDFSFEHYFTEATQKAALSKLVPISLSLLTEKTDQQTIDLLFHTTDLWNYAYQINDDITDWRKDFSDGNITFPLAMALNQLGIDQYSTQDQYPTSAQLASVMYIHVAPQCLSQAISSLETALERLAVGSNSRWGTMIEDLLGHVRRNMQVISEVITRSQADRTRMAALRRDTEKTSLQKAEEAAATFIAARQDADGGWRDFMTNRGEAEFWTTGYVGYALARSNFPHPQQVERAVEFLKQHHEYQGGWGYHRGVGSDADSTAWCLQFLHQAGCPKSQLSKPLAVMLEHQTASGGFVTYTDPAPVRTSMGLEATHDVSGWCQPHACVTGAVAQALNAFARTSHSLTLATTFLVQHQDPNGCWNPYWYLGPYYATSLALQSLAAHRELPSVETSLVAGSKWLLSQQHVDGSWGSEIDIESVPFFTALAVSGLLAIKTSVDESKSIALGLKWLLENQQVDGGWRPSAYMLMPDPGMLEPWKFSNWKTSMYGFNTGRYDHRRLFTAATVLNAINSAIVDGAT